MSDTLRLCRNAVKRVPKKDELLDKRNEHLVAVGDSSMALSRLRGGFGRLFRVKIQRRTAETSAMSVPEEL